MQQMQRMRGGRQMLQMQRTILSFTWMGREKAFQSCIKGRQMSSSRGKWVRGAVQLDCNLSSAAIGRVPPQLPPLQQAAIPPPQISSAD